MSFFAYLFIYLFIYLWFTKWIFYDIIQSYTVMRGEIMKKILSIMILLALIMSFSGCNNINFEEEKDTQSEEDKIKKAEAELGKLYYRDYAVGEEMDTAEYLPWCQKIDESKQTIADLRDYIEELKMEQVEMEVEDVAEVTEEDFADNEASAEEEPEVEIEIVVCEEPKEEE